MSVYSPGICVSLSTVLSILSSLACTLLILITFEKAFRFLIKAESKHFKPFPQYPNYMNTLILQIQMMTYH